MGPPKPRPTPRRRGENPDLPSGRRPLPPPPPPKAPPSKDVRATVDVPGADGAMTQVSGIVTNLEWVGVRDSPIDVTHVGSATRQFIPGQLYDPGEVTMTVRLDAPSAPPKQILRKPPPRPPPAPPNETTTRGESVDSLNSRPPTSEQLKARDARRASAWYWTWRIAAAVGIWLAWAGGVWWYSSWV